MTRIIKYMLPGAGLAALAAAAPASAQYAYPYGYSNTSQYAAQRCAAAVQSRLNNRGLSIFGIQLGSATNGQVLSVTQVTPRRNSVRVRGIASSGRMAYNPYGYGVGAYGMLGSNYGMPADLTFSCNVDYRGFIRDVDINRRY
jgi:hypothetical protein